MRPRCILRQGFVGQLILVLFLVVYYRIAQISRLNLAHDEWTVYYQPNFNRRRGWELPTTPGREARIDGSSQSVSEDRPEIDPFRTKNVD